MSDVHLSCEQCHAAVLQDQIVKKLAGRVGGKLLCVACVKEKIKELQGQRGAGGASGIISNSGPLPNPTTTMSRTSGNSGVIRPAATAPRPMDGDEPIALIAENEVPTVSSGSVDKKAFIKTALAQADRHEVFKRPLVSAAEGATRCRTFHSKLTDAALSYMDNQINEWSDAHPEVHVKFATSTIGLFEAKQHQEPHLIVSVFY